MPSEAKTRDALSAIRDNILLARRFVQGLSLAAFQASSLHVYAAVRAVEIVSEASRRLPEDMRARHPHLPWRSIRDAGNLYRHDYEAVAASLIWATVHNELPALLVVVEAELAALGDQR